MNEVKCYRVNTWWHWCRAKFHGAALSRALLVEVNLDNLMSLKEETHDTMLLIARRHKEHDEPLELIKAICAEAFYHTYGQQVRVVRGRKVPQGIVGECFWMGYKSYGRVSAWAEEVCKVLRIGIRDADGEVYWTTLNNVEVIPEVAPSTSIPESLYRFPRKFLDLPSLYGEDETDELKAIREELEKLHKRYAVQRELVEKSRLHLEKVEGQFGKDSPEAYAAWDEENAVWDSCRELQNELEDITRKYFDLWDSDIRPILDPKKHKGGR